MDAHVSEKAVICFQKTFFLRLYFWDEGHLYAKFLLNILTIDPKCHFFQFFSRDIRMYIPILTRVQNGRINVRKNSVILLEKNFFKKFIFWDEGHANCYVYILTIYFKCFLFKFLGCNMCYAYSHPNESLNWTHH